MIVSPAMTGDALYDQLMAVIEPELLIASLPTLEEKYKDETDEQARSRAERYEKAFDAYDQALAAYMAARKEEAEKRQRNAMSSIEQGEHDEEMQAVEDLLNGKDLGTRE